MDNAKVSVPVRFWESSEFTDLAQWSPAVCLMWDSVRRFRQQYVMCTDMYEIVGVVLVLHPANIWWHTATRYLNDLKQISKKVDTADVWFCDASGPPLYSKDLLCRGWGSSETQEDHFANGAADGPNPCVGFQSPRDLVPVRCPSVSWTDLLTVDHAVQRTQVILTGLDRSWHAGSMTCMEPMKAAGAASPRFKICNAVGCMAQTSLSVASILMFWTETLRTASKSSNASNFAEFLYASLKLQKDQKPAGGSVCCERSESMWE